jgi:hypothetical protein
MIESDEIRELTGEELDLVSGSGVWAVIGGAAAEIIAAACVVTDVAMTVTGNSSYLR